MTTVNVGQAKTELSRLIALALAGEDVAVARDGVPVVRLVPIEQRKPGARFLAARRSLARQIRIGVKTAAVGRLVVPDDLPSRVADAVAQRSRLRRRAR